MRIQYLFVNSVLPTPRMRIQWVTEETEVTEEAEETVCRWHEKRKSLCVHGMGSVQFSQRRDGAPPRRQRERDDPLVPRRAVVPAPHPPGQATRPTAVA